jgi:predicted aspartyl protease
MDQESEATRKPVSAAGRVALLLTGFLFVGAIDAPVTPPAPELPQPGAVPAPETIPDVVVEAPEPRYVAPTRRDKIGRIWAPVLINGKGPFRLVLDTGASHSAVNAGVAAALGIPLVDSTQVMLRGVTGSAAVPSIAVDSLIVGDLELVSRRLPIVIDALGGAEGILGTEGLLDKRIFIDFRHDKITIFKSHNEHAGLGFVTIPVNIVHGLLLVVDARIGTVPAKAIIDTGGQATLANVALRDALARRYREGKVVMDEITGATLDVQQGDRIHVPPISLGDLTISDMEVTTADMYIFQHWKMTSEPAVLIGMDVLGLLDTLIIDYRRKELQIRTRNGG